MNDKAKNKSKYKLPNSNFERINVPTEINIKYINIDRILITQIKLKSFETMLNEYFINYFNFIFQLFF